MNFIIDRAKLIEIQITQTGQGSYLQFPTNMDDLNNAKIYGMQIITSTQLTTSPAGRPVITDADMAAIGVTLAEMPGSNKRIDTLPAYSTNRELNAGRFFEWKGFVWNPSSSKINVLASGVLATTDSILFMVYYTPL